jgi:PTH1 family peptidyl-tRNA hydrolase
MSEIKLIVGLGNPGGQYALTRHNVGFQTVDLLAEDRNAGWKNWGNCAEIAALGVGRVLVKPQTYMNNSGIAVRQLVDYYRLSVQEVLVVYDDFALPLGTLRLRKSGSAGGHNGLSSIINHLKTSDIPRLRLGIGPLPPHVSTPDFVLSRFSGEDLPSVGEMLRNAVETVDRVWNVGFEKAVSMMGTVQQGRGES